MSNLLQSNLLRWGGATAVAAGTAALLGPSLGLYSVKMFALGCMAPLLAAFALVWLYTQGQIRLPEKMGLGITIIGATIWEVGWVIMTLFSAEAGWTIFIMGWFVLSLGLLLMGIATIQKKALPRWNALLLVIGLWPALAEFANPYFFANNIATEWQIAVMVFYGLGWTLLGYTLRESTETMAQLQPQQI